jgi:flotillin
VPQADEVIVIVGEKQRGHNGLTSNVVVITGGGAFIRS